MESSYRVGLLRGQGNPLAAKTEKSGAQRHVYN